MKKSNEFEQEVIDLYCNKLKWIYTISKELKCSRNTIIRILKDNNIKQRTFIKEKKTKNSDISIIIKLYNSGEKCEDIGKKYNVNRQTIINLLVKNGIKIRKRKDYNKYPCDDSFFEKINTEAKAYFLGLMYADGNVSKGKQTNVRLTLQERDKHILETFKKYLNYECPLHFGKTKNLNRQNRWTLYLCNRKVKDDLIKLGCVPAKSLILKFPTEKQVPERLLNHFIRGYFDGDGCISLAGTPTFSILSTKNIADQINLIIDKNTNIGIKNLETHPNNINMQYRIGGKKQIEKVYNYLYNNASIYLNRKFDKFQQLFNKEEL